MALFENMPSEAELAAKIAQERRAAALAEAQLDPVTFARMQAAQAGGALREAVGPMLGLPDVPVDPRLAELRQVNTALREATAEVPQGDNAGVLEAAARRLVELGRPDQAMELTVRAQNLRNAEAQRQAQILEAQRRATGAGAGGDFSKVAAEMVKAGRVLPQDYADWLQTVTPEAPLGDISRLKVRQGGPIQQVPAPDGTPMLVQARPDGSLDVLWRANAAPTVTVQNMIPGTPRTISQIAAAGADLVKPVEPIITRMGTIQEVLGYLSQATTNPQAAQAAKARIAATFRVDSQTSLREIQMITGGGSLADRFVGAITDFVSGTLTPEKVNNFRAVLREVAEAGTNRVEQEFRSVLPLIKQSPPEEQGYYIDRFRPGLRPGTVNRLLGTRGAGEAPAAAPAAAPRGDQGAAFRANPLVQGSQARMAASVPERLRILREEEAQYAQGGNTAALNSVRQEIRLLEAMERHGGGAR